MTGHNSPQVDPGQLWLEGKTVVVMAPNQDRPTHMPRGPAKRTGPGFLNPAMAPARTRSVLLLNDALEHHWLVDEGDSLRALDALCATGVRVRRWRNEIAAHHQPRLRITANDLDRGALDHLHATHRQFPPAVTVSQTIEDNRYDRPPNGEMVDGLFVMNNDARIVLMESAYQWIDIDPFGSPVAFLDAAIQGLSRVGFLEVTATDTAALTGSSASSQQRRYGAKGIVDRYAHDDAVRVLLGLVATTAARHDRTVEPVLALFDGHHVRVSVKVRRSREDASSVLEHMGWRVRSPNGGYRFVRHPTPEEVELGSGPMWMGPLWDKAITKRMTEEKALEVCSPSEEELDALRETGLEWSEHDREHAQRELRRSVRFIAAAADLMSGEHTLYHMDDLPRLSGVGSAPRMERLFESLATAGFRAARVPDIDPFFITDTPLDRLVETVRALVT